MRTDLDLIEEERPRRPVMRYHGGKWVLAPWIISHFPEHRVYVEPYGGAASVLIQKPRSSIEVYNDLDDDVVNLFRVLRDPITAAELCRACQLTCFSRAEFEAAYVPALEPVEKARRLVVRSFFGFGSHSFNADNSNGFRWMPCKSYAKEWGGVPQVLQASVSRLHGVTMECRPALEVISNQDGPDTLFFVDPPYPLELRDSGGKGYRFEMSTYEHRLLAHVLRSAKGKVVLCGYPCELYDRELYADWHRVTRNHYAGGQAGRVGRTEVLWMNFTPPIA